MHQLCLVTLHCYLVVHYLVTFIVTFCYSRTLLLSKSRLVAFAPFTRCLIALCFHAFPFSLHCCFHLVVLKVMPNYLYLATLPSFFSHLVAFKVVFSSFHIMICCFHTLLFVTLLCFAIAPCITCSHTLLFVTLLCFAIAPCITCCHALHYSRHILLLTPFVTCNLPSHFDALPCWLLGLATLPLRLIALPSHPSTCLFKVPPTPPTPTVVSLPCCSTLLVSIPYSFSSVGR